MKFCGLSAFSCGRERIASWCGRDRGITFMPVKIAEPKTEQPSGRSAFLIGTGIILSRLAGLVRERALAHYLGILPAADAFRAALRIPNFLQNLFGEGVLSASFIPVYSRLLVSSDKRE